MRGVPGSCHYCANKAIQNVFWLYSNTPTEPVPHCGCDLSKAIAQFYPNLRQLRHGVDYFIKEFEKPAITATGDGINVTYEFRMPDGSVTSVVQPKIEARRFANKVQEAARHPEPGCDDPTDHFRGHCGCK